MKYLLLAIRICLNNIMSKNDRKRDWEITSCSVPIPTVPIPKKLELAYFFLIFSGVECSKGWWAMVQEGMTYSEKLDLPVRPAALNIRNSLRGSYTGIDNA